MSATPGDRSIRVIMTEDHTTAQLVIPVHMPRDQLTPQLCHDTLRGAGVEVTAAVIEQIKALLEQEPPVEGDDIRRVVAQATLPEHGKDGQIEWVIQQQDAEPEPDTTKSRSHYERSAFILVKPGDVLAKVIEPTLGIDGRDVLGGTMPAKHGKPVNLKFDDSIMKDGQGRLIAQMEGVLQRSALAASIRQALEVEDHVDFSTGNIDFSGDVLIRRGVRDRFVVKAQGNIVSHGLIEAATIHCGGDLIATKGIAGRELGTIQVGGNLEAKYLDNISGSVGGDLSLDKEVINCTLLIKGAIRAEYGRMIGGRYTVTGPVELTMLGSAAGTKTELILGFDPELEAKAHQLSQLLETLQAKRPPLEKEVRLLTQHNDPRMSSVHRERLTELTFELQGIEERLKRGQAMLDMLRQAIDEKGKISLSVSGKMHGGTVLIIGDRSYHLADDIRGPLRVYRDAAGRIAIAKTEGGGVLARLPQVRCTEIKKAAQDTNKQEQRS